MPDPSLSTSPPASTAYLTTPASALPPQQSAQQQEQQNPPDHASQGGLTASDPSTSTQQPRQLNSTSISSPSSHLVPPDPSSPDLSQQDRSPRNGTHTLADLPTLQNTLSSALKQYPDFPTPGILFEDILPLFADPYLHKTLLTALDLLISSSFSVPQTITTNPNPPPPHDDHSRPPPPPNTTITSSPDLILGLEARGFLFGPSLALSLGAGFVAVRKPGKLPGETLKAGFTKEYGKDGFEVQKDAIGKGKTVVVVDDVLATGGSAAAAGELVRMAGGRLLGYVFLLELGFLGGRDRLDAGVPVRALLRSQGG